MSLEEMSDEEFVAEMDRRFEAAGRPRDEEVLDRLERRLVAAGLLR